MKRTNTTLLLGILVITACNSPAPAEQNTTDSIPVHAVVPADSGSVKTDTSVKAPAPDRQAGVDRNEKKYTNEKGEVISAIYHDSGDMGIVVLNRNGASIKLMKGAKKEGTTVYTNGKIVWKIKGDEASFEKDDVVSVYKESK